MPVQRSSLSIGFVVPYGEHAAGFFPDTFLALLCAAARERGHRAEVVRVFYDGINTTANQQVAERLTGWLDARDVDLVVCERIFDPDPIVRHTSARADRRLILVSRGDAFERMDGIDLAIGAVPTATRDGRTRRSATIEELVACFRRTLEALERGEDPLAVQGVSRVVDGRVEGTPIPRGSAADEPLPLASLDFDTISLVPPPPRRHATVFGNAGCPFAEDAAEALRLDFDDSRAESVSRLGCSFCFMGGDYQKRPDEDVVASLVRQARHLTSDPEIESLIISDQHPYRYLERLLRSAADAGVRPVRWLFSARTDAFVKLQRQVRCAIEAARATGQILELYLSGFESFSDTDLRRYNKGVSAEQQLAAIQTMRALRAEFPDAFDYRHARGHSLVLWNPWTTPETLLESLHTIRENGLMELFDEPGRNRLRLHNDLAITAAAVRDGAVVAQWDDGDEGAARRKGYNPEQPWRFLDERTALAWRLAGELRDRLGTTTDLAQLIATAEFARNATGSPSVQHAVNAVLAAVDRLDRACQAASRGPAMGAAVTEAAVVRFTGICNNGCLPCANRESYLADSTDALHTRVGTARDRGLPILFVGREPTLHREFPSLVGAARGTDQRRVGVVTNGRRFVQPAFLRASLNAGLRSVSVRIFGPSAEVGDAYSRAPGGFEQAVRGLANLRRADAIAVEMRIPFHARMLGRELEYVALADGLGVRQIRAEVALDAVGLVSLDRTADGLQRMAERCADQGIAFVVSPLRAGTQHQRHINLVPGSPMPSVSASAPL